MNFDNVAAIKRELEERGVLGILTEYFKKDYYPDEVEYALRDIMVSVKMPHTHSVVSSGDPKDYTEYRLEGMIYKKSPLVLAVLKAYVRDNPDITWTKLKAVFPDYIQGSCGVVVTPDEGRRKRTDPEKRYHTKNPIILKDNTVVWVCTQWGADRYGNNNIGRFIKKATELGYTITPLK